MDALLEMAIETLGAKRSVFQGATRLELILIVLELGEDALFYRAIRGDYGPSSGTDPEIFEVVKRFNCSKYIKNILERVKTIKPFFKQEQYLVELVCKVEELVYEQMVNEDDVDKDWVDLREIYDDIFIARQEAFEAYEKEEEEMRSYRKSLTVDKLVSMGILRIPTDCILCTKDIWDNSRYHCEQIEIYKFKDGAEVEPHNGAEFLSHYQKLGYEVLREL